MQCWSWGRHPRRLLHASSAASPRQWLRRSETSPLATATPAAGLPPSASRILAVRGTISSITVSKGAYYTFRVTPRAMFDVAASGRTKHTPSLLLNAPLTQISPEPTPAERGQCGRLVTCAGSMPWNPELGAEVFVVGTPRQHNPCITELRVRATTVTQFLEPDSSSSENRSKREDAREGGDGSGQEEAYAWFREFALSSLKVGLPATTFDELEPRDLFALLRSRDITKLCRVKGIKEARATKAVERFEQLLASGAIDRYRQLFRYGFHDNFWFPEASICSFPPTALRDLVKDPYSACYNHLLQRDFDAVDQRVFQQKLIRDAADLRRLRALSYTTLQQATRQTYMGTHQSRAHSQQAHAVPRRNAHNCVSGRHIFLSQSDLCERNARRLRASAARHERGTTFCFDQDTLLRGMDKLKSTIIGSREEDAWLAIDEQEGCLESSSARWYTSFNFAIESRLVEAVLERLECLEHRGPSHAAFERYGVTRTEFEGHFEDAVCDKDGVTLDSQQRDAVRVAFDNRFGIVTGGPGTGKTHVIASIVRLAQALGGEIVLVCPTGKAAQSLRATTQAYASTIHSALRINPSSLEERKGGGDRIWAKGGAQFPFSRGRRGKDDDGSDEARFYIFVVDEASMLSYPLAYHVLEALASHSSEARKSSILLVGDCDQISPVDLGHTFSELCKVEAMPLVRLEHNYRQAHGSRLAHNIKRVLEGLAPDAFDMEQHCALGPVAAGPRPSAAVLSIGKAPPRRVSVQAFRGARHRPGPRRGGGTGQSPGTGRGHGARVRGGDRAHQP